MKFLLSLIVSSVLFMQPVMACAQFGGKAGMGGKAGTGGGPTAAAAPTFVQAASPAESAGQTSITFTYSTALTAGNNVVLCLFQYSVTPTVSFNHETWTADPDNGTSVQNIPFGSNYLSCWTSSGITGGETSIVASCTGGGCMDYPTGWSFEIHGGVLDKSDSTATGSGVSPASNSITPTANNSLIIGLCVAATGGTTTTPGTNVAWTIPTNGSNTSGAMEYFSQTAAASVNAQCGISPTNTWIAHILDYHP